MATWRRISSLQVLTLAIFCGCTLQVEPGDEAEENVAARSDAVGGGDEVSGWPYSSVGSVQVRPNGAYCTGTLITPGFMLTAAHCFIGERNYCGYGAIPSPAGLTDVIVDVTLSSGAAGRHSPCLPGTPIGDCSRDVLSLSSTRINMCSDGSIGGDIVLLPLNERIPMREADPLHPILNGTNCGSMDTAILAGYGSTNSVLSGGDVAGYLNANTVGPWERQRSSSGRAIYQTYFDLAWSTLGGQYFGSHGGDSGGPLFNRYTKRICGVTSGHLLGIRWIELLFFPAFPQPVVYVNSAAVDSSPALSFLRRNILDEDGRFIGECLPNEGPAGLRDQDTDRDMLPDACDPCPRVPDVEYRYTGRMKEYADRDGDGVPDVCDTCPLRKNPYNSARVQADQDEDGLGDACDWCVTGPDDPSDIVCCAADNNCGEAGGVCVFNEPGSPGYDKCNPGSTFPRGRCATARDRDNDRVGDNCDNCPGVKNSDQLDTDSDSTGDDCDLCSGVHEYPEQPQPRDVDLPVCDFSGDGDSQCRALTGNLTSTCARVPHASQPGRGACTFQSDADGDGIGDLCDGCPQDPDAAKMTIETNCNLVQEVATNVPYPYKSDQCDPAPCASFVFGWDDRLPNPTDPQQIQWNVGGYTPRSLPNPHPGAFNYVTGIRPRADVGFRYCECELDDEVACARNSFCRVGQAITDYTQSQDWKQLGTVKLDANPIPPTSASDPPWVWPGTSVADAEIPQTAMFSGNSNPSWQDPVLPYASPGELNQLAAWDVGSLPLKVLPSSPLGAPGRGLNVVMWSHVRRADGIAPASEALYRKTANSHVLGVLGTPPVDYPAPGDFPLDRCGPFCDFRDCKVCEYERFDPSIWINPVDGRILLGDNGRLAEVSDAFSAPLRTTLLGAGDARWVMAAEPREFRRDDTVFAAVLSAQADQIVALVQRTGSQFVDARTILEPGPGVAIADENLGDDIGEPVSGGVLVLSANERSVFAVGGTIGYGDLARPAGIRRFSTLDRGSVPDWSLMSFQVSFGAVLAASYSAPERALYALDHLHGQARLWKLDVESLAVTALGSWRYGGADDVFLAATWDGEMILATTDDGVYRIAKFGVKNGQLVSAWETQGVGTLVAQPSLKQGGLDVITVNGNGVRRSQRVLIPAPSATVELGRCLQ